MAIFYTNSGLVICDQTTAFIRIKVSNSFPDYVRDSESDAPIMGFQSGEFIKCHGLQVPRNIGERLEGSEGGERELPYQYWQRCGWKGRNKLMTPSHAHHGSLTPHIQKISSRSLATLHSSTSTAYNQITARYNYNKCYKMKRFFDLADHRANIQNLRRFKLEATRSGSH